MRAILFALYALAFVGLAPSPALAQLPALPTDPQVTLRIDAPSQPIPPGGVTLPYDITYVANGAQTGQVTLVLATPRDGGWMTDAQPTRATIDVTPGLGQAFHATGHVRIAPEAARAFEPTQLAFVVTSSGNDAAPPARGTTTLTVQAAWRPGLFVTLPQPGLELAPGSAHADALAELRVTGNAPETITLARLDAPHGCRAEAATPNVTLGVDERASFDVALTCDKGWSSGELTATFEHALASDTKQTANDVVVQWDVTPPRPAEPCWLFCSAAAQPAARSYGDAPRPAHDAPWASGVATPLALGLAALLVTRKRA